MYLGSVQHSARTNRKFGSVQHKYCVAYVPSLSHVYHEHRARQLGKLTSPVKNQTNFLFLDPIKEPRITTHTESQQKRREEKRRVPLIQFLGGWKWYAVLYLLLTMEETLGACGYRKTLCVA